MEINYDQFLKMIPEASLTAILIITFIADFVSTKVTRNPKVSTDALSLRSVGRPWFNTLAAVLMLIQTVVCFLTIDQVSAFGGMYVTTDAVGAMKVILAAGTLIVIIQARQWLHRPDTLFKEGEFYMLVISTLLGMNMMMSAGHFLMFFLGLEMASVPMACLIALDKYRHHSAEGGAKYVLTATFSSGIMLYGISLIYAFAGTLYFDDVANILMIKTGSVNIASSIYNIDITSSLWLVIMGLVFFFSGLAFKLSLVPFHFWTADAYQGAPTTVTGYLSVISKGAAALTLMIILTKVFAPLTRYWLILLYIVIALSITVGNLFAIRQKDLKRFMAFSSISQAGYIMLAAVGANRLGVAALSFYVLVYVAANLAVFTIIAAVEEAAGGRTDIRAYDGFYQTNPKLSLLMTIALFSLAGIPPFAGMFSKFFVFMSAAQQGSFLAYLVVFIALINTVVSLYYYLLIVKAMYIRKTETPLPTFRSETSTKLALAVCTAGILAFGVFSCFYRWLAFTA